MPLDTSSPPTPPKFISVKEIEAVLRRLRGVVAIRVACDATGAIGEIHAVAEANRPAKMLVRDIESALRAHWNLPLNRNKISVAQFQQGQATTLPKARLRLVSAGVTVLPNGEHEATVTLRPSDSADEGHSAAARDPDRTRALAAATVRAVEMCHQVTNRLRLADIVAVSLAGHAAFLVLVILQTDKGDDLLTGSALRRSDADRAVVAATLDAVNRRLSALEAADGAKR